jgi:hypothetical protein
MSLVRDTMTERVKRLFKSVIAVIVIFNQLRCVFIRTLSVEGVASEFSRSLLLGSPRSLLVFFFSFFPGIFLRERSRPVFFVFAVSFSSFLGRPKLLLVFRRFYVVGCVIAITVDASRVRRSPAHFAHLTRA